MPNPPPRTPAECLATIILWLSRTVDSHSMWGKLARPLAVLILDRLRALKHRFDRLAARIEAGRFASRRPPATPRRPAPRRPRTPNPLPQKFAWMVRLVQETAVYGSQLQHLLQQPEMVALMQAAPAEMRRVLRRSATCWGSARRRSWRRLPPPGQNPRRRRSSRNQRNPPPASGRKNRKSLATCSASATLRPSPIRPERSRRLGTTITFRISNNKPGQEQEPPNRLAPHLRQIKIAAIVLVRCLTGCR